MLSNEEYIKVILDSPIPCMWIEFTRKEDEYYINILGINGELDKIKKDVFKLNFDYKLDKELCKNFILNIANGVKQFKVLEYVSLLNSFYKIDVKHISKNKYIIWFTKKIEIDENIKELIKKMDVYLWCKDKNGKYVYINRPYESYKHATPEYIIGKNDFEIFPKEIAERFVKDDKELLEGKKDYVEALSFFNENCYDGINKVVKDEDGNIIGTIGMCANTLWKDRKTISDKISDSRMLELISDTIPDSIFFKDVNGIFRHCNKVFAENRNMTKEDIIGKSEKEINTLDKKIKKYEAEEKEIVRTKRSLITTNSFEASDGRKMYFETIKVPFLDDHKMVGGVLGISRDISHRREAELEFERLRMEFFANLSHEFKTPLNLIFSSIQLIEFMMDKGDDSKNYRTYTNIIKQNGYRLLKMVNNLIDSTRLNAGCLEYNPINYNIVEFIENICDSVQYYSNQEHIKLIFDTNLEEKIMAFDLEKMERIMLNLLSNAIKYNNENGKIEVSLKFTDETLKISVKDSGIGIPKDKLDEVFLLFKQVNNRMTKKSEGSGIGLSIVKSLVDLHGGSISVYSEQGQGSEFIVNIPIIICESKKQKIEKIKHNKYVENINIEFSDIYTAVKSV
ncbi:PAS domain-containing sensor histidine kinase [Romboutsia lituseburensis]|uniref:sensor histidine kinase n=1 Tax=Romboutsia lituseburensis TaxID=1537 RepID=UPI0022EAB304|nr:PAS domain-containing sensor histidine kinase [Romboutsia lituseburensis]